MQAQFDATSNVVTELVRKLCTEADQTCMLVLVLVLLLVLLLLLVLVLVLVPLPLPLPLLRLVSASAVRGCRPRRCVCARDPFSLCWELPQRLTRRASGGRR